MFLLLARDASTLTRFFDYVPLLTARPPADDKLLRESNQSSTTSKHNKATWHLRFDASTEPLVVEQQHLDHFHRHVVLKEIKA